MNRRTGIPSTGCPFVHMGGKMTRIDPRPVCLALAVLLMGACATPRYATDNAPSGDRVVRVEVTNHNWMDMAVYAVSGGQRIRLGTVTTGLNQTFRLPKTLNVYSGQLFLEAQPVGSREVFRSDAIMVNPGGQI